MWDFHNFIPHTNKLEVSHPPVVLWEEDEWYDEQQQQQYQIQWINAGGSDKEDPCRDNNYHLLILPWD